MQPTESELVVLLPWLSQGFVLLAAVLAWRDRPRELGVAAVVLLLLSLLVLIAGTARHASMAVALAGAAALLARMPWSERGLLPAAGLGAVLYCITASAIALGEPADALRGAAMPWPLAAALLLLAVVRVARNPASFGWGEAAREHRPLVLAAMGASVPIAVLTGWYTHNVALIQGGHERVAMQFNTALAGLGLAVALWAVLQGWRRLFWVALLVPVALAGLSLVQVIWGLELGTDVLLFRPWSSTELASPGRMAPNTAAGVLALALAIAMLPAGRKRPVLGQVMWGLCVLAVTVCALALVGYALGEDALRAWGSFAINHLPTAMSLPTALTLGLLGAAVADATFQNTPGENLRRRLFPGIVMTIVALVSAYLWFVFDRQENILLERRTEIARVALQDAIATGMQVRIEALRRMVDRTGVLDPHDPGKDAMYRHDVQAYLRDFSSWQAFAYVPPGTDWDGTWSATRDSDGELPAFDLQALRAVIQRARSRGETIVARLAAADGRTLGAAAVPATQALADPPLLLAIFSFERLFEQLLPRATEGFEFTISSNGAPLRRAAIATAGAESEVRVRQSDFAIYDLPLRIDLWPTARTRLGGDSRLPEALLVTGLLTGVLMASVLSLAALARRRAAVVDRTNRQLRESGTLLAHAQKLAMLGTWELRLADGRARHSAETDAIFGLQPGEFGGTMADFMALVHPDDRAAFELAAQAALQVNGRLDHEFRIVTPAGIERVVHSVGEVERDQRGQPVAMRGTLQDISERRRAERRFRTVVEAAPNGVLVVDRSGRISLANEAVEHMMGYGKGEMLGLPIEMLVPETMREQHLRDRGLYQLGPQVRAMGYGRDLTAQRRDGSEFPIEVGLTPIDVAGEPCVLASVIDITERRRSQKAVAQLLDDLRLRNRELQDFAFVASHDLQEPLRKIQAFGDRLQDRCAGQLGPEGNDYLDRMQKSAARMRKLIEDLLDYSRVSTRGGSLQPCDLNEVMNGVVSDLETRLEATRGQVYFGHMPTLIADPTQMRQLLQNLIGNALKFHRPGVPPEVEIEAKPFRRERRDWLRLLVRDNGLGFDDKYRERIFTPFQRLHGRGEYEGTGIGLAIVRRIVERHGGTISAEGRPGVGATFTIEVPLVAPEAVGQSAAAAP